LALVEKSKPRLLHRDLDRFRVGVERVVAVEVLDGQRLLSIVLREAPQHRPLAPCGVADDLPTLLSRSDGDGLQDDPATMVYAGLDEVAVAEVRLLHHILWQRHHAAVADPAHMDHCHDRTSRGQRIYGGHTCQWRVCSPEQ